MFSGGLDAHHFAHANLSEFLARFPELARAVDETGRPADEALGRLHDLHRRHGKIVSAVMQGAMEAGKAGEAPSDSLLELYRAARLSDFAPLPQSAPKQAPGPKIRLVFDRERKSVNLGDVGTLTGTGFRLLDCLAGTHLAALGRGCAPEDMPSLTAGHLVGELGYEDEGSARRSVMRTRSRIAKLFEQAGHPPLELIETLPPNGYRLVPEVVQVLTAETDKSPTRRKSPQRRRD